jgi:hypothetical protein
MAFSTKVEIIKKKLNSDGQQFHQYARGNYFCYWFYHMTCGGWN